MKTIFLQDYESDFNIVERSDNSSVEDLLNFDNIMNKPTSFTPDKMGKFTDTKFWLFFKQYAATDDLSYNLFKNTLLRDCKDLGTTFFKHTRDKVIEITYNYISKHFSDYTFNKIIISSIILYLNTKFESSINSDFVEYTKLIEYLNKL